MKVTEDVTGEQILASTIGTAFIGGSLVGDSGGFSGSIFAQRNIGSIKIGHAIMGAGGGYSGHIESFSGSIGSVDVGAFMIGGAGDKSGQIMAAGAIGKVKIGGDVAGSGGLGSGSINAGPEGIGSVILGGALRGGTAAGSGFIFANEKIGSIKTGAIPGANGDIVGGTANRSGGILCGGDIGEIFIKGDLKGGTGSETAKIETQVGRIGKLTITGSMIGTDVTGADNVVETSYVLAEDIGKIVIGKYLRAGNDLGAGSIGESGAIVSNHAIQSLTVHGSIMGGTGNPFVISAVGSASPTLHTDIAIGKIRVDQSVTDARILAGYDDNNAPKNIDAQIGAISVGADVLRTNLIAGAIAGAGGNFGTSTDASIPDVNDSSQIVSRIASIQIGGVVDGSAGAGDNFGFVASEIGSLKIGGTSVKLNKGPFNDMTPILIAATTNDVHVREI